jgi:hypothetical protein
VFVEYYLSDFARRHEREKVVDILRKTLKKMSPKARNVATTIPLDPPTSNLLQLAL